MRAMAGGVMGSCTHVFIGQQASVATYGGWAEVHREWSMVTGAVFATRKSSPGAYEWLR